MQRFQWPDFKMQLLAELQRQQNQTQFCDTLLQTEGISVPAHSCILAALSPYLSQKLSASPPPPCGQKRQLKLQALKARTLLKLVGLLYSGELEVTGNMEQNDVLAAVHQLGITELVEGHRVCGMKEGEPLQRGFQSCKDKEEEGRRRSERLTKRDAGVQSDTAEERAADCVSKKRSSVSTGTQTDPFHLPSKTQASNQEPASSLPQCTMQTLKTPLDQRFAFTSIPDNSSLHSGTPGDETPALIESSDSITTPMSSPALSNNVMAHKNGMHQLSSEGKSNKRMVESRENGEDTGPYTPSDEELGVGSGHSDEKRQYYANTKLRGMAKMKQMLEATQISIKVKLRRRTKEQVWEVVNLEDKDETLAVLTSMQQDDSNQKRPQSDPSNTASPPSSAQPASVPLRKASLPQHASTDPAAPHSSSTSESQVASHVCFTPNPSDGLESVPLPQPPGPVEDTDEQIEKMLEDIMMGLNILPALETGSKRSQHPKKSNDQASASCQIQHTENDGVQGQVHAGERAAGYWCCQDFGTHIGLSSTDTGQTQQCCSSLTYVQLDAVQNHHQQQQQLLSVPNQLSVTSMSQRGELSHQGMTMLSKSQTPNHEVATASSFNSSEHKLHHPECKKQSSQQDQNILEILPLANGNQAQSSHSFSLLRMDELRLPPLLSPLESFGSTSHSQPVLRSSTGQTQPSQQGPPWLTETPECLRFPFSAITPKNNQSGSLSQDKGSRCWEKGPQEGLKLIPHRERARTVSCYEKEKRMVFPHVADRESNIKKDVKCKQSDARADARKRKNTSEPDGFLPCKELKVSDGKESQLNLTDCSVSLSSNNVLAKEREMASRKPVRKPNEPSTVTESQEIRRPWVRIRTRSFLRRPEETQSNPNLEQTSALRSMSAPQRKRGRPRKSNHGKSQESSSAVNEQNNNTVQGEPHTNDNLSKEEESKKKTERKGKKRIRNRGEVKVQPPKPTSAAKSTTETDVNQNMNPAGRKPRRPGTVILKEFQKLIKQQHFKTRKSKESQDENTNNNKQTSRKAEGEGKAEDNTPPDNTEGANESHGMNNSAAHGNHNQTVNESVSELSESRRDDRRSFAAEEVSLFDTEQCSGFSLSDPGEEREQSLRSLPQAQAHDKADSDSTHWMINGEGSHNDPIQPQEDVSHMDCSLCPQRTVQPLLEADGCNKLSGYDEDDEEVDILLYSPDRVPQTMACENGQGIVDLSPEEDEDEDVKEIDVTGDEAD